MQDGTRQNRLTWVNYRVIKGSQVRERWYFSQSDGILQAEPSLNPYGKLVEGLSHGA